MPHDLMLFPDTYEVNSDSGVPVFKAIGFVLGLDSGNKVITSSRQSKLIATMFLKTLLTRKGSSIGSPSEGTKLPDVLNYPQGSDAFESDTIAAVLDAESQLKKRLANIDNQLGVTLSKAQVIEANSNTGSIKITLLVSNNETASVVLPGKKL